MPSSDEPAGTDHITGREFQNLVDDVKDLGKKIENIEKEFKGRTDKLHECDERIEKKLDTLLKKNEEEEKSKKVRNARNQRIYWALIGVGLTVLTSILTIVITGALSISEATPPAGP